MRAAHAFLTLALLSPACRRDAPPATAPAADRARALRDVMRPESREALDRAPVPLLLPNDLGVAASALVTAGPSWVAASIPRGDHTLSVHATNAAMAPPVDNPPRHSSRLRGLPATVTANEGIRVATWEEGGVAYQLEVECARPSDDVRCTDEAFIRQLAEGLVRVEGVR